MSCLRLAELHPEARTLAATPKSVWGLYGLRPSAIFDSPRARHLSNCSFESESAFFLSISPHLSIVPSRPFENQDRPRACLWRCLTPSLIANLHLGRASSISRCLAHMSHIPVISLVFALPTSPLFDSMPATPTGSRLVVALFPCHPTHHS